MWIREGKSIASYPAENKEVMIVQQDELTNGMLTWADQIICAKNETRTQINNQMRELYNFPLEPQVGDKIISLTNHWDFSDPPLTNGSIGIIQDSYIEYLHLPRFIKEEPIKILYTTIIDETGHIFYDIPIDYNCLLTGRKTLTPKQEAQIRNNKRLKDEGACYTYIDVLDTNGEVFEDDENSCVVQDSDFVIIKTLNKQEIENAIRNINDETDTKNWTQESMHTLEGGKNAFYDRKDIYESGK